MGNPSDSSPELPCRATEKTEPDHDAAADIALPDTVVGSGTLDRLVETARGYVRDALAAHSTAAYRAD